MSLGLSPLTGFAQSDQDTSGATFYYGYLQATGSWYIVQVSANNTTYRYIAGGGGSTTYATNWTNRATLTYDYYSNIFTNA